MTFIKTQDSSDSTELVKFFFSNRLSYTTLKGRDEILFSIPPECLTELVSEGFNFEIVDEKELPDLLSEGGLNFFNFARENSPEIIYWNKEPIPALHIEISISHLSADRDEILDILRSYDAKVVDTDCKIIRPVEDAALCGDSITAVILGARFDPLLEELSEKILSAFSRESCVFVLRDPDRVLAEKRF